MMEGQVATHDLDTAKQEAFAGQMVGLLNNAFIGILISIGHQTALFDTMAGLPPSTSAQVADAARLHERYVREWLGAMVTAHIVVYDAATRTYHLPPEHATALTRAAGPNNLAAFTRYIALAGDVESQVVECFRSGGGVPYSAYPQFQALQREETAAVYDATLVNLTLPLVPGLMEQLQAGIDVADMGCGSGHAINLMAHAFPSSRFVGYDFSEAGIVAAQQEAEQLGISNASFQVQDVAALAAEEQFDCITAFDTIHDQAQPRVVLKAIARALRPEGVFLMQDIAASSRLEENLEHPFAPFLYAVSVLHCMTVSLAQGGEGLGTVWGEQQARELLAEAGFTDIAVEQVEGDGLNNYYIAHKR
jgi:2-polyprenyl-3-methyl-5-hydroxy-6-metoxy-1,4-benzoquinol methylase